MQKMNMYTVGQKECKKRTLTHFSRQIVAENDKNGHSIGNNVFSQFIFKKA